MFEMNICTKIIFYKQKLINFNIYLQEQQLCKLKHFQKKAKLYKTINNSFKYVLSKKIKNSTKIINEIYKFQYITHSKKFTTHQLPACISTTRSFPTPRFS